MNKRTQLTCTGLISLIAFTASYGKEPENLYFTKQRLIRYHDSGEYQRDQAKVINQAMQYLRARLRQEAHRNPAKKLAIVLSIDETSLSNYADMLKMNFGGTLRQIMEAENKGADLAITPTLQLYQYAKANHVAVFFVTGRTEAFRVATEKNLANAGYKNWDGLSFKADNYNEKSTAPYKIRARNLIEKQGYDIILNVADQQSALVGGHADKTFKLPNPYYLIP
ncbi:MAG TPA: HAD family acid phosphatase [Gammaproteobacteria bacterium]|nr:HAD family acid phosphatase [Gammaproteobacteria bacterium]